MTSVWVPTPHDLIASLILSRWAPHSSRANPAPAAVLLPTCPVSSTPDKLVWLRNAERHSVRPNRPPATAGGQAITPSSGPRPIERASTAAHPPLPSEHDERSPAHPHPHRQRPHGRRRALVADLCRYSWYRPRAYQGGTAGARWCFAFFGELGLLSSVTHEQATRLNPSRPLSSIVPRGPSHRGAMWCSRLFRSTTHYKGYRGRWCGAERTNGGRGDICRALLPTGSRRLRAHQGLPTVQAPAGCVLRVAATTGERQK